ncbi:hypothetical protein [Butyrivibrio sp. YAB3001]|uniref:hypothetical protein n=1 Tax=Butyrivibrio sp. YAB3001 TaxID=1520812 RepID=UPI000B846C80|nr:hypothetical protein [Butyrivibrio sp. YAB3001]
MIGFIMLFLHIFIVIIAFFLMKKRMLKIDRIMFVIIVCIPFWGMLSALIVSFMILTERVGVNNKNLENMKSSDESGDTIVVEAPESENVVPLQDALIMDDPSVRRSVMLDVLMSGTKSYIPVINEARMNDDVEVVHYATTAMVELSKEFELKAQEYSARYAENPEEDGLLEDYISFLEQYVSSNMIQGQLLEIQRNTLMQLLAEKVSRNSRQEDYVSFINALFAEKQFSIADTVLSEMETSWPKDERCIKLRLRYYYETGAGNKIKEIVDTVKNSGNYYSREIRDLVDLWDIGNKEEQRA